MTLEDGQNAMRVLKKNDAGDWDSRLYCYGWEAERLLASGVRAEHIVVIPSKLPLSKPQGER